MRTNIDIDDALLEAAMRAGPYKTKKDAVEAGLKLLARQAHYREVLKWEGRLRWDGDATDAATADPAIEPASRQMPATALTAAEPDPPALAPGRRHGRR